MRNEAEVRKRLVAVLGDVARQRKLPYTAEPVENILNKGTFDLWMAMGGKCAWVEIKCCGPAAAPTMRSGQAGFGVRCLNAGVPAWVFVGSPMGGWRILHPLTTGKDWPLTLRHTGSSWDGDLIDKLLENG